MDGGRRLRLTRPGGASGQQTSEFVLVIGMAALAALSMQLLTRRAVQGGLTSATDTILGAPPAYNAANESLVSLSVGVRQTITQNGRANFRRTDNTHLTVAGHSVVYDEKTHLIPNLEP